MIKHYVEFFYRGAFVSELSSMLVPSRDVSVKKPETAYGYRFYSREEVQGEYDVLTGPRRDIGPMAYFGTAFTAPEIEALNDGQDHRILLSNMRCNCWDRVVLARGGFFPLEADDMVVPE